MESPVRTIVVSYDDTDTAERALEWGAEICDRFGARLVVLAVGDLRQPAAEPVPGTVDPYLMPVTPMGSLGPTPRVDTASTPTEPEEPVLRMLERARFTLARKQVEAEFVSELGDPADALLRVADEKDADLIVVGSREHGFLERLLGGAVDDEVARRADCDVLLVR
jgi:nucleotide-binding universal stress UspA family protein